MSYLGDNCTFREHTGTFSEGIYFINLKSSMGYNGT